MEQDGIDLKGLDEPGSDALFDRDALATLKELNDGIVFDQPEDPDVEGSGP